MQSNLILALSFQKDKGLTAKITVFCQFCMRVLSRKRRCGKNIAFAHGGVYNIYIIIYVCW